MSKSIAVGVIDVPYSYQQQRLGKNGKPLKKGKTVKLSTTTGQVAGWLEDDYGVMQAIFDLHEKDIYEAIERSMAGGLHAIENGAPPDFDIFGSATSKIENVFKEALSRKELDGRVGGVPTGAAQRGVSHRFAHPYAKRPPRPSFIDTGMYQSSIKAWVE